MVTIGYLGLIGEVTTRSVLIGAILVSVAVLSFSLGHQPARYEHPDP